MVIDVSLGWEERNYGLSDQWDRDGDSDRLILYTISLDVDEEVPPEAFMLPVAEDEPWEDPTVEELVDLIMGWRRW